MLKGVLYLGVVPDNTIYNKHSLVLVVKIHANDIVLQIEILLLYLYIYVLYKVINVKKWNICQLGLIMKIHIF